MGARVDYINRAILRQCREQMALNVESVKGKVPLIEDIEAGVKFPTYKQLDTLADLYKVPRWVFISEELPPEYDFVESVPAFRQFTRQTEEVFSDPKVRGLVAQIGRLRELVIELREDIDEPIEPLSLPKIEGPGNSHFEIASAVRSWLRVKGNLEFPGWKSKLEQKGIFVFMTDKYKGWSHMEKETFRGLSIYHPVLPIIIVNDSDAKKAQSFTLLHELGHLFRKENAVDSWSDKNKSIEKWCDELAGEILMPRAPFLNEVNHVDMDRLEAIKKVAKEFHVSPYACLVRLRNLRKISQNTYSEFEGELEREYRELQKKRRENPGGGSRNRPKEVLEQYGRIYTDALFQAYYNKELSLHKLSKLFGLKQASQALELGKL